MANNLNENLTKYLDYNGLGQFLAKLKEYIADRISEVNGSNLNLYNSGETNPTITSEIEKIWTVLGEGGDVSISGQIQSILGQYVKDIQQGTGNHAGLDDLIKVSVVEGTGDSKDIYTISLEGTGLVEKLQDLTSERVSSIDATGTDGGAVTLSIDKSKGDVKLTVNSKALTERVKTLEDRSGKYNSGYSIDSGYLLGGESNSGASWRSITPTYLKYEIGSGGLELGWPGNLTIGTDFYGGIILGTMPDSTDRYINIAPEHSTRGITIGSGSMTIGTEGIKIGSDGIKIGSNGIAIGINFVNIGVDPVSIGTPRTITIGSDLNNIKLKGQQINLDCSYGVKINNVIVGTSENSSSPVFPDFTCIKGNLIGTAQDSLSLEGHSSSYFATADSHTALKERVNSLESNRIKSVTKGTSIENYLTLGVSTTDLNTTITIDDVKLKEKIADIDAEIDTLAKASDIPTKLPNPNSLTVKWKDTSNTTQSKSYDGVDPAEVDLTGGVYYAKTSTNSTNATNAEFIGSDSNNVGGSHQPVYINGGKPTAITIDGGTSDTENCLLTEAKNSPNQIWSTTGITANYSKKTLTAEGGFIGDLQGNAATSTKSSDSDKLGGQLPSYYAAKSDLNSTNEDVQGIQNSYVKDITTSNSNTGTKYVTISPTTAAKNNVTITIDDTAVREEFESIDNYTINGKKISTSPTLTGDDITLGKSVGDNTNYPTTMDIPEAIQKLRETITGLGKVVNLSGVYEKWEDYTSEPNNGDFVIVGQKEYVYWDKWIELGDTTQVTQYLNDLINKYNSHTHAFSVSGSVESSFTGTAESHGHTFTGNSVETTNNTLSVSYSAGKLTINTSHKHTVTPTGTISNTSLTPKGTITSSFSGGGVSSGTNSTQSQPPIEPGAPMGPGEEGGGNDYSLEYFTIEALEDGLTAKLSTNACEYRIDDGDWISLTKNTATPSINSGQKISFKITNPTISAIYGMGTFTVNKSFNVEGNIMSLLYGDNFEGQTDLSGKYNAFRELFRNCTKLQHAENLILPATTLADYCYQTMFSSCTSLTTAPQLPATILAQFCYANMFEDCTSLTTAPELPVTTLTNNCYSSMFEDCTSLTTAPELLATTLVDNCYKNMFSGCSNLNYIKMVATDINAYNCLYGWVYSVASSGTFVKHPDMTSLPSGYSGIPNGWTVQDYQW